MADVAAKREARMRRILENSQNRLEKITGRVCESTVQGTSSQNSNQNLLDNLNDDSLNSRLNPRVQGDSRQSVPVPEKSFIYKLFFGKLSYPLLAFIVNIMFLLNLDDLFGKTVVAPYFALIIVHILFHETWSKPQEANMLIAALLLCNVNPKLINRLRRVAIMCKLVFQGLSLYFISFVTIRWVFSFIWIDIDITPPENSTIPDITN